MQAERFAASLGLGLPARLGMRQVDGMTLVGPMAGHVNARTWAPAKSPRGDHVLFTGHIDNRAEVLRSLKGAVDPNCDDATLYGHCKVEFAAECDLRLVGQYAAILCSSDGSEIQLVRSPIHAPPLHIWRGEGTAIIASVPRAIYATGEVRQEVDEQKIADTLFLNYTEAERGWFRGVSRLPVGTRAVLTPDGMQTTSYYDPFAGREVRYSRDQDYVDAANELFDQATRAALQGFSKPAISLSGGLDSQAVAVAALQALPQDAPLYSFTSVPEPAWDGRVRRGKFGDERAHVQALADMYPRILPNFIDAAGLGFDHKLDAMFLHAGVAPRNAANLHWIHEGHAHAKSAGCDVVLTGGNGNLTFSFNGNGAIPNWVRQGAWATALRETWAGRRAHKSFAHAFAAKVLRPFLPRTAALGLKRLRFGAAADFFQNWCPLNSEWATDMKLAERAQEMGHDPEYAPKASTQDTRRAMLGNAATETGDLAQALQVINGIALRDPTSYRPLLEFCFNIPDDQYVRNGRTRWLARRMLKGKLPKPVLNETRRGLQNADWHVRLGRQRTDLLAELDDLSNDPRMAEMLNLGRLRKALENWPDETPIDPKDPSMFLHLAVSRGLTTARFVRYVEGRNR